MQMRHANSKSTKTYIRLSSQYTYYNRTDGFDLILLSNPPRTAAYRSLVSGCVRSFSSY